jgi:hypothetical protein
MVMDTAPATKIKALDALGATITRVTYDEAGRRSSRTAPIACAATSSTRSTTTTSSPATRTAGLEILEDLPDVDTVIASIGGGGLLAGLGAVMKALKPGVRVLAAEPETASPLSVSFAAGRGELLRRLDRLVRGRRGRQVGAALDVAAAAGRSSTSRSSCRWRTSPRRCATPPSVSTSSPRGPPGARSPPPSVAAPVAARWSRWCRAATSISPVSRNSSARLPRHVVSIIVRRF